MFRFVKTFANVALATVVVVAPLASAGAAQPQGIATPQVAVPSPIAIPAPVPAGFAGNWEITQDLYGPYRMRFTLSQYGGGNYRVTGGGLNCNGGLSWYQSGNSAVVQLYTSYCGNGVNWTGDRLTCVFTNYYGGGVPQQIAVPQVAVPSPIAIPVPVPTTQWIRCTYQPAAYGYQAISVLARRY